MKLDGQFKANRRAESLQKFNNGAGLAIRIWVFLLLSLKTSNKRMARKSYGDACSSVELLLYLED